MFITLCKTFRLIALYLHMTPKKSIFLSNKFKVNPIFTQKNMVLRHVGSRHENNTEIEVHLL